MANKRKTISKKMRFEVFKRDAFTCQYCGKSAPEVIVEVDHITPVAEGGTNEMYNLVTACRDCNRGKGKRKLSNIEEAKKERKYLEEEQEKLEQAKMIIAWKEEVAGRKKYEVDKIDELIAMTTHCCLSDSGIKYIRGLIDKFSFLEVYEAVEIALDYYYKPGDADSLDNALNKIGGICYNRRKQKEEEDGKKGN